MHQKYAWLKCHVSMVEARPLWVVICRLASWARGEWRAASVPHNCGGRCLASEDQLCTERAQKAFEQRSLCFGWGSNTARLILTVPKCIKTRLVSCSFLKMPPCRDRSPSALKLLTRRRRVHASGANVPGASKWMGVFQLWSQGGSFLDGTTFVLMRRMSTTRNSMNPTLPFLASVRPFSSPQSLSMPSSKRSSGRRRRSMVESWSACVSKHLMVGFLLKTGETPMG